MDVPPAHTTASTVLGGSGIQERTRLAEDKLERHSTLSTVTHWSPMLLAGSIAGRPHSKWWWCHDIGYPLLAVEHSQCKAPWSGTPCRMTSAHSRTMSPLDSAWKPGFSLATSVLSALETSWQLRCINSHLPYHTIPYHSQERPTMTWIDLRRGRGSGPLSLDR